MTLIYLAAAWMAGIYVAERFRLPLSMWALVAVLPFSVAWLWRRDARVWLPALCALFGLLGGIRYLAALPRLDERSVATYNDRGWVELVGIVAAEPDERDTYVNLRVRAETLAVGEAPPLQVHGMVLVRVPRFAVQRYGDRVLVQGSLETPPVFEGFSYRDYLARQGIYSLMRWARVKTLARRQGNLVYALMLAWKRRAQAAVNQSLPEPSASLLSGILLGVEGGIPDDLLADFRTTGTSHIIAISGFNMAIVAGMASSLSVRLIGRRYAAWLATAAIALYTMFVGASAAVVRAALMGAVAVWGTHLGRQNSAPHALFATAMLMTAWNPYTLWDLGFLLSFTATLGLIALSNPLQGGLEWLLARLLPVGWAEPTGRFLNEPLVLSTCAQLMTLPIIVYSFGTFSPITWISNLAILPAQTQVMLWGGMATVGGMIWLPLGRVLAWIAHLFLAYTIWVVEATARVPHMAVDLKWVSPLWVGAWYVLLAMGAWWMAQPSQKRHAVWRWIADRLPTKLLLGGLAIGGVLVVVALASLPDGKLHLTVLDVGAGDAILIETPSGQQVLVDGGPSPGKLLTALGRRMPFWDRRLELAVLTALDDEHLPGLAAAMERYQVANIVSVPVEACRGTACAHWEGLLQERAVVPLGAISGLHADLGDGVTLALLHPLGADQASGAGEPAIVRLDYGATCFLLAESAGWEAEQAMLARGEHVRCDVLLVGKHASRESASQTFLEAVRPALAIVSCDEQQRSAQPDERTLERLGEQATTVLRTDQYGSIEVIADGERYEVRVGR